MASSTMLLAIGLQVKEDTDQKKKSFIHRFIYLCGFLTQSHIIFQLVFGLRIPLARNKVHSQPILDGKYGVVLQVFGVRVVDLCCY